MKGKGKRVSAFIMAVVLVTVLSVNAVNAAQRAADLKEISAKEIKGAEHNGKIYTYTLQKQYETSDPEEKAVFDERLDGGLQLEDATYEIIKVIPQKKIMEEQKDYKGMMEKDDSQIPKSVDIGGQTYNLENVTWSEEPNIEHVSYTMKLGYSPSEPEYPAEYEYTYISPITKKENTATLPFARMEHTEYGWTDGFTATVTFHNLDGEVFNLGDHEFTYNPDRLDFTKSDYEELVRMLGYDTSKYRFTSASWSGKPYKGKNGERYRDATAFGQQYGASFSAVYEGDVENGKTYAAHAVYTCEIELPEEEAAPTYVMQATGYYGSTGKISPSVWIVLTFIMLLILFFVCILIFRKKKEKPDKMEEKEVTIDKQFIEPKQFKFDEEK